MPKEVTESKKGMNVTDFFEDGKVSSSDDCGRDECLRLIAEQAGKEVVARRNQASVPEQEPSPTTVVHRVSSKQRKLSLDEYRATFLQVPRIVNRRPVFVSEEVRKQLDLIVLRLSETRRMSVTGLLENICRHHIEMYKEDIEQWRKL